MIFVSRRNLHKERAAACLPVSESSCGSPRYVLVRLWGKPVSVCASVPEGVEAAKAAAGEDGMVCAVGSLYMAGAVRACFGLYC